MLGEEARRGRLGGGWLDARRKAASEGGWDLAITSGPSLEVDVERYKDGRRRREEGEECSCTRVSSLDFECFCLSPFSLFAGRVCWNIQGKAGLLWSRFRLSSNWIRSRCSRSDAGSHLQVLEPPGVEPRSSNKGRTHSSRSHVVERLPRAGARSQSSLNQVDLADAPHQLPSHGTAPNKQMHTPTSIPAPG